jgi:uncharacterized protein YjbJ (UPF0337 family)
MASLLAATNTFRSQLLGVSVNVLEFACHGLVGPQVATRRMVIFHHKGEHLMKDSTKDKVEGAAHELKGAVKETLGHATNDRRLEVKGKAEKVAGKVQKKVGDVEKVLGK